MWLNINNCTLKGSERFGVDKDIEDALHFWIDGVICVLILTIGLITNSITVFILRSKEDMKQMFNYLLSCLLIIDNVYLVMRLIGICYWDFENKSQVAAWTQAYLAYPFEKISLTAAIFTTVCLAHQRYVAILDPTTFLLLEGKSDSKRKRTISYMLPVIVFAVVVNIPKFFSYTYEIITDNQDDENITFYAVTKLPLRCNYHFIVMYENLVINIITVFAPITSLMLFNWSVHKYIRGQQKEIKAVSMELGPQSPTQNLEDEQHGNTIKMNRSKVHTKILFIIIFVFVFCHGPRCLVKFYDVFYEPFEIKVMKVLNRLLLIIHSSVTPLIYITNNDRFREHLSTLIRNTLYLLYHEHEQRCESSNCQQCQTKPNDVKVQTWLCPSQQTESTR